MKTFLKVLGRIAAIALISCLATVALLHIDRQCAMMYGTEGSLSKSVSDGLCEELCGGITDIMEFVE